MRVLTYVNGTLTVIDGDNYFNEAYEKPSFILGNAFYYEPTLKMMDETELTEGLITNAENYIDGFVFEVPKTTVVEEVTLPPFKDYVDQYGNYFYTNYPEDSYLEITKKPVEDVNLQIWDFTTNDFYSAKVIDKITNLAISYLRVDSYNFDDVFYGRLSNYNTEICNDCQTYNIETKQFNLNLVLIKEKKASKINEDCLNYIKEQNGDIGNITSAIGNSWYRQEVEAKAYANDNASLTPYIDQILLGRNTKLAELNKPLETRDVLIAKVLQKADTYNTLYGNAIGKLTIILNQLEEAQDYETISVIKW